MHARADYLVDCLIDGHPQPLMIIAADEADARGQVERDWGRGARLQYRTPAGGKVTVQWANVATLEVRGAELVTDYGPGQSSAG